MDRFASLEAFVAACEAGSFSGAGRRLRLSGTMVAKHVDALESRLGVRLLQRTTRRLTLTEEGRAFRERATALLDDFAAAERAVGADRDRPHGTLRLNAPMSYGVLRVAPLVAEFVRRNPGVRVEAAYVDRVVDLVEEGWDLAIRIAAGLPDSRSLIVRTIATERLVLCAAPGYLARRGTPGHPGELAAHACLAYTLSLGARSNEWRFEPAADADREISPVQVRVDGPISASNGDALKTAAVEAHGFVLQPEFIVAEDIAAGRLSEVRFEGYDAGRLTVFAVYPAGRHLSSKVRSFVSLAASRLGRDA